MDTLKLLTYGYTRLAGEIFQLVIPDVIQTIITYYVMMYKILAIGSNSCGAFGLGNTRCISQWEELYELEDSFYSINSINDIHISWLNIMIISSKKELYISGENSNKQLGLDKKNAPNKISLFTKIPLDNVKLVSSINQLHSFMLTNDNKLYANGVNKFGSFGNGMINEFPQVLQKVNTDFLKNNNETITDIKCVYHRSVFLSNLGNVYCCGSNMSGESGVDAQQQTIPKPLFVAMPNNEKITKTATGLAHTLLIDENNQVICFGENLFGQFGIDNNDFGICLPTLHDYFTDNQIKIIDIDCQIATSLFIDMDHNVYSCGFNEYGNVGIGVYGIKNSRITAVHKIRFEKFNTKILNASCGAIHSVLLSADNDLICWGNNSNNQCSTINNNDIICSPYTVSKKKELNISENDYIERISATYGTIVFVNCLFKRN